MPNNDLQDLYAFLAVARAGGFREAARLTDGSPSSLSEAIRRLEVEGFPAIVVNDCHGGDLLEAGKKACRTSSRPIPAVQSLGG